MRFEASDIRFTGTVNPAPSVSSPSRLFLPVRKPPKLVALTVNDNPVASDPTGSFEFPDVTIDGGHAAVIIIGASDVLPGTVVRVHVNSENAPDQVVNSEPLTGSQESSTATVTLDLPPGFSRGSLRAVWTE